MTKLFIGLTALGMLIAAFYTGFDAFIAGISEVGFFGTLLLLSLSLLSYLIRFLRWKLLLNALNHNLPLKEHLLIYLAGFSLTMTPGKAGEAVRSVYLKDFGVPYGASFSCFVMERFFDMAAIVLFVLVGSYAFPQAKTLVMIMCPLLLVAFFIFRFKLERWFKCDARGLLKPKMFLIGLSLGLSAWFLEGVSLYLLLSMLKSPLSLIQSVFAHAFGLLIGAVTFLPGGVGGAEVSLYEVLIQMGCGSSAALTATFLIRLATLWFSMGLGFCALLLVKRNVFISLIPNRDLISK